jgi:CheY-like chemotaxis protein
MHDEPEALRRELALVHERLQSLVDTSLESVLCLEYLPPVPTTLPPHEQATRLLDSAFIVACNAHAAKVLPNVDPKSLVGRRWADVMPHARDVALVQLEQFVRAGYRQELQTYPLPLPDGGTSWTEVNRSAAIVDGAVVRSWSISRDVTAKRTADERLRVSEERLRSYVEQSKEEVWCWRFDPPLAVDTPPEHAARAIPRRAILVDCNEAAVHGVRAMKREDILGKTYAEIFPGVDRVDLFFTSPGQSYTESEVTSRDPKTGVERRFSLRRTHRIVNGHVVQTWATARDVTDERRAAELVRASEEALRKAEKIASLGALARGIAYDFSRLLARMIADVEVAQQAAGANVEARSALEGIRRGVSSALDLVGQIESFTPRVEPARADPPASAPEPGAHLLLVDDEPQLARVAEKGLVALGYRVTAHASSTAALDAFRANPRAFDIVVTDQTMPDLHGLELATAISQIRCGVPILLMSGYAEIIPPESLRSAGIVGLLAKPFTLDALGQRVRAALDARARASDAR